MSDIYLPLYQESIIGLKKTVEMLANNQKDEALALLKSIENSINNLRNGAEKLSLFYQSESDTINNQLAGIIIQIDFLNDDILKIETKLAEIDWQINEVNIKISSIRDKAEQLDGQISLIEQEIDQLMDSELPEEPITPFDPDLPRLGRRRNSAHGERINEMKKLRQNQGVLRHELASLEAESNRLINSRTPHEEQRKNTLNEKNNLQRVIDVLHGNQIVLAKKYSCTILTIDYFNRLGNILEHADNRVGDIELLVEELYSNATITTRFGADEVVPLQEVLDKCIEFLSLDIVDATT